MKKISLILSLLIMASTARALPFVTTPNPSTYPIHWYKLKIAGYYLSLIIVNLVLLNRHRLRMNTYGVFCFQTQEKL